MRDQSLALSRSSSPAWPGWVFSAGAGSDSGCSTKRPPSQKTGFTASSIYEVEYAVQLARSDPDRARNAAANWKKAVKQIKKKNHKSRNSIRRCGSSVATISVAAVRASGRPAAGHLVPAFAPVAGQASDLVGRPGFAGCLGLDCSCVSSFGLMGTQGPIAPRTRWFHLVVNYIWRDAPNVT
jgi:hypothetical protein